MPDPVDKPRYYEKGGKLYDAGVEISEKEADSILERNAVRRAKNAASVKAGTAEDAEKGAVMSKFSDLANKGFDDDEKQLRPILERRRAAKGTLTPEGLGLKK